MPTPGKAEFEQVVRAYANDLFRYLYWLCRDRAQAEDLVQETFARAWKAWAAPPDEKAVKAWLYTILHNTWRNRQRDGGQLVDHVCVGLSLGVSDERLADRAGQIQRGGQCTDGLDMRPSSFPALQRAHSMYREARNRGEFLLRVTGSFPQASELHAERPRGGSFHGSSILRRRPGAFSRTE